MYDPVLGCEVVPKLLGKLDRYQIKMIIDSNQEHMQSEHWVKELRQEQYEKPKNNQQNIKEKDLKLD